MQKHKIEEVFVKQLTGFSKWSWMVRRTEKLRLIPNFLYIIKFRKNLKKKIHNQSWPCRKPHETQLKYVFAHDRIRSILFAVNLLLSQSITFN